MYSRRPRFLGFSIAEHDGAAPGAVRGCRAGGRIGRWAAGANVWLLVLVCASCAYRTTPARLYKEDRPYLEQGRVQFESRDIPFVLRVVRVDAQRVSGGLLRVWVTLRNTRKEPLWVEVRTTFLDKDGHPLDQTNWHPVQLAARTVTDYTCTSLSRDAADYQVVVRRLARSSYELP